MDLVVTLNICASLKDFVETKFGECLSPLEINKTAAEEALAKVKDSLDQKQQFWSVINHLQGADAAIRTPEINDESLLSQYNNHLDIHYVFNILRKKIGSG